MNILFFLTPKNEVAYVNHEDSLRQVLEKLEHHGYTAVPIIDQSGKYTGTITEGDLLWAIKNETNLCLKDAETIPLARITRQHEYKPVKADCKMEDLVGRALNQNFVPVIDDDKHFIGIVTRKEIIKYFYENYKKQTK